MENGVIVVCAAGNAADERDDRGDLRSAIDLVPGVFEGPDYPLIVVGATNYKGCVFASLSEDGNTNSDVVDRKPADWSQGGSHLTILGPGVRVQTLDKAKDDPLIQSGTSFSAPLVAGVLATFLAYDDVPFDLSDPDVSFVQSAKNYLRQNANWERIDGVPVIWNEVEEDDNPTKADVATLATTTSIPITTTAPTATPTPGKAF